MKKKPCIITIFPDAETTDVKTGDMHHLDILDSLKGLMGLLSRQVLEEARKHVGDDPKAQERWIDLQRQNRNNHN
jgi:hypothetical protein